MESKTLFEGKYQGEGRWSEPNFINLMEYLTKEGMLVTEPPHMDGGGKLKGIRKVVGNRTYFLLSGVRVAYFGCTPEANPEEQPEGATSWTICTDTDSQEEVGRVEKILLETLDSGDHEPY